MGQKFDEMIFYNKSSNPIEFSMLNKRSKKKKAPDNYPTIFLTQRNFGTKLKQAISHWSNDMELTESRLRQLGGCWKRLDAVNSGGEGRWLA